MAECFEIRLRAAFFFLLVANLFFNEQFLHHREVLYSLGIELSLQISSV